MIAAPAAVVAGVLQPVAIPVRRQHLQVVAPVVAAAHAIALSLPVALRQEAVRLHQVPPPEVVVGAVLPVLRQEGVAQEDKGVCL